MDKEIAMALGEIKERMNELGRRIDNFYAQKDEARKAETIENENAILDEADVIDENSNAVLDLADYVAELEERVAALEGGQ